MRLTRVGATKRDCPPQVSLSAGLTLDSVEGEALAVPAASLDSATVEHVHADPLRLAQVGLSALSLPSAQSPTIANTASVVIPLALGALPPIPIIDLGFLSVDLILTPHVETTVQHLDISTVTANATVGQIELDNVTVPFDVFNLTLSQVGINTVAIPTFAAS